MATLHHLGAAYGRRPSTFVDGLPPLVALMLDLEALKRGRESENRAQQKVARGRVGR